MDVVLHRWDKSQLLWLTLGPTPAHNSDNNALASITPSTLVYFISTTQGLHLPLSIHRGPMISLFKEDILCSILVCCASTVTCFNGFKSLLAYHVQCVGALANKSSGVTRWCHYYKSKQTPIEVFHEAFTPQYFSHFSSEMSRSHQKEPELKFVHEKLFTPFSVSFPSLLESRYFRGRKRFLFLIGWVDCKPRPVKLPKSFVKLPFYYPRESQQLLLKPVPNSGHFGWQYTPWSCLRPASKPKAEEEEVTSAALFA